MHKCSRNEGGCVISISTKKKSLVKLMGWFLRIDRLYGHSIRLLKILILLAAQVARDINCLSHKYIFYIPAIDQSG